MDSITPIFHVLLISCLKLGASGCESPRPLPSAMQGTSVEVSGKFCGIPGGEHRLLGNGSVAT
jgi:hypothetical protein